MLDLLDFRRQVTDLYRIIRERGNDPATCVWFRERRDEIFRTHPQSALDAEQKAVFTGLPYFEYDPAFRVIAPVSFDVAPKVFEVETAGDGLIHYRRFGKVAFELPTGSGELNIFWIMGYGGGVFLPFGDSTNKTETYGAGRYLYDTIKGVDLGADLNSLVLDFNYAYNPSCAYNPLWVCPLSPPENRLKFPVPVGEKRLE